QRLLAVRHARAGTLAELFDHRGGNLGHGAYSLPASSGETDASGAGRDAPERRDAISTFGPSPPDDTRIVSGFCSSSWSRRSLRDAERSLPMRPPVMAASAIL